MTLTTLTPAALCPGFDEPVHEAQQTFRQVLTALAEPGTLHPVQAGPAPEGVHRASWLVCLTLLDAETPLWIAPPLDSPALRDALRFHCGCPLVSDPRQAAFALLTPESAPLPDAPLAAFDPGTHAYPDRSATLILQLEGVDSGGMLSLTGPGISGSRSVSLVGLDATWLSALEANHTLFPCGVDLILTAPDALMGLPRTTAVQRLTGRN
ncbi:MAG: phosphonate C-P lyase system protein PhnH [Gammaproteobacteria bacterium]|nr:phosphonate C-P lyase system protein PhnH [Gammaproteobacteria bacterium]